nr:uncharacterized protein LOC117278499 [Nicotiana tomentosiformis]
MRSSTSLRDKLPEDPKTSRALYTKEALYSFWGGQLYMRSFQGPLARCLGAFKANYVMREVHEEICGNHSGEDSLVLKVQDTSGPGPVGNKTQRTTAFGTIPMAIHEMRDGYSRAAATGSREAKRKWPEELPGVLLTYWTTAKSSTGETSFSLVYDVEALIPVEMGEPTLQYFRPNEETNNEALPVKLELLDERRDLAHIRMMAQKQRM